MSRSIQARNFSATAQLAGVSLSQKVSGSDFNWVPKSFRSGLPARADPVQLLSNVTIANYPLPIYSTPDVEAKKAQLAEDTKPVEETGPSPLAVYGFLPTAFFGSAALLANEIFLVNEESMLMGTWAAFLLTSYVQFGDVISKEFADRTAKLREAHLTALDKQMESVDGLLAAFQQRAQGAQEAQKMNEAYVSMLARLKAVIAHKYRRILNQTIIEKLNQVVNFERNALKSAYQTVVTRVTSVVSLLFRNNKVLRRQVLNQCLDMLAAGPGKSDQKDILGGVYKVAFKFTQYEMELLRIQGYKLSEEDRVKIYRSIQAAMRKDAGESYNTKSMDKLVPAEKKLPAFSRYVA